MAGARPVVSMMNEWTPHNNIGIHEERFKLSRQGPENKFRTFQWAVVPDIDVPGNLLHIRPVTA